jgi:3-methyladenine DNA glycosylase/8-oxoguanine DNA glycosylase
MESMAKRLERAARLRLTIPEPFDFALTVAKPAGWHWSTPAEVFEKGVLWSAFYLGEKPVGLKLSSPAAGSVSATAYTEFELSSSDKTHLREALEFGLGKSLDLEGFYRFARKDPVLRSTVEDRYGMRLGRLDELFGRVILAITLQMAQLKRSRQMMGDILSLYGTTVAFDGRKVTLWPMPRRIARLDPMELREKANMGYRAKLLWAAARYFEANPMSIRELDAMPDDEAVRRIKEIPGIGEYSAGIVLTRYAPIDAWSVIVMSELLLGTTPEKPRADINTINQIVAERWGEWSWMAFAYILNDLDNLARDYRLTRMF